jgi:hypothetical protein
MDEVKFMTKSINGLFDATPACRLICSINIHNLDLYFPKLISVFSFSKIKIL